MMLVRMPNTRSGIIVRIERVATTNIDAKRLLAAPACSAICEVSIGGKPILRSECLRGQCSARALIVMYAGGLLVYGQKTRFSRGFQLLPPNDILYLALLCRAA